jgi:hypothetical protein
MSYFTEIDAWLTAILTAGPEDGESDDEWFDRVKSDIKEKLLESYRNGQLAGLEPKKPVREDKPRGIFRFRKPGRQ